MRGLWLIGRKQTPWPLIKVHQFGGGAPHSTQVALVLLTQLLRDRISAFGKDYFLLCSQNSSTELNKVASTKT